jgi:2-amino-4-hydroxy-6-hydroxymethyldihydropteridine diphosphokinase
VTLAADALVIGLGGNLGGDEAVLERFVRAREALAELGALRSAPLYRTAAIGPAQPDYLNSAVRVRLADATPGELVATVLELEALLGRDRRGQAHWGPRTIDLDVLVWGARVVCTSELELPHPRLHLRRFALLPLIALVGEDTVLPGQRQSLGALERAITDQPVDELSAQW